MPVTLRVTFADGTTRDMRLPAETWIRQASTDVPVADSPVVRAVLDPDHKIPDKDRTNNASRPSRTGGRGRRVSALATYPSAASC